MYASEQDIIDTYGAARLDMLADLDGDGARDAAKIARALDAATGIVDGYVSSRYALPLSRVPGVLRDCCVSIAVYRLASDATLLTEDIRQRYEDAIAFLKDVARGVAALSVPAAGDAAPASSAAASPQSVIITSEPRVMGRRQLRDL